MDGSTMIKDLQNWLSSSDEIDQQIYNDFLATAKFVENKENDYYIVVKSTFGAKMVDPFLPIINKKIKSLIGQNVLLTTLSVEEYKKETKILQAKKNKENTDYKFSFETFVQGDSNTQAFTAAKTVVKAPGMFNPLFIYGDSGLGKTHLLKAIKHELKGKNSDLNCIYVNSDDFGRQVVDVIREGHEKIENFKRKYTEADILLIDDVQFLAKKEKTNEFLFTIFNHYIENGKQLVFSSDKVPDQLNGFDARLITRFNLGLTAPLNALDFLTALSIVEVELEENNLKDKIADDAKEYISKYFANDVRKIKGSIAKINFWIMTNNTGKIVDMSVVTELFKDIPTSNLGILNVKKIKEAVAEKYGISIKLMEGKARVQNIVNARHVAMYLTKDILDHSLAQIGTEFGGKDHSTVISALKKIQAEIAKNKEFKKIIEILKSKILSK
ncbi:chromosomal replication initiator protein DnaA [Williamsoniiplasma somnilux]|uniref:Chromosomal replication initiator protein DnaA n=1 Tax=Williamsoniiplasma somnilux TaxID=215578 RepID=A0A2K8NX79_9MOLU|nr:chromosomal replication initiator protein DnaA [Williamsoniiplasma somnilux]ATZ18387.1 chromosomal replication initiator protein DnaA [Williamsoniiplasma somnilux]